MSCLNTIQQMLVEEFGLDPEKVKPETPLEELGIDSLATAEFMFLIEDKFNIKVPGEQVTVNTVEDIATEIDRLIEAQKQ